MAASTSVLMALLPPYLPPKPTPPASRTLLAFSPHNRSFPTRPRSADFIRFPTDVPRCSFDEQPSISEDSTTSFCIIEGPETVEGFVQLQMQEIDDNIKSRRNKIFLLMEEVRRLRIQQRLKIAEHSDEGCEDNELPDIPSTIPFLSHTTPKTLRQLYMTSFCVAFGIIVFGGLVAPILELKLGLGGTSYEDFINNLHLPLQLSQVDPIVASFSGGAIGVISALMVLETNNVQLQEKKICKYCHGSGYLACARCSARGLFSSIGTNSISDGRSDSSQLSTTKRCPNCSGTGKVMCPTCLCTGMAMASEHDPRIDPFD
ncbi:protein ORANGE-LIKE, chloroplastic-like [Zingiber officinale]|uniref:protein ORANGE-LIKE, chloroplastic-like n=1 Tax=Zingiber officinale TaxID=94328 RepID=UPI001C4B7CDD|nr:protein ORANGE-LIKE, chloroplastic-like [Zingiber officinale]